MTTTYRNPWHRPGTDLYGSDTFTTDAKPLGYRGYLIYHRIAWDVVFEGCCVGCYHGLSGAKGYVDGLLAGDEIALFHAARAGHAPTVLVS